MKEKNVQMLDVLDRVMRLLKRGGSHPPHHGRASGRTLHMISEKPGISTRELAELLDVRPSSLNEALGRLEEHGLILRERSNEDQRVYCVSLTEKGKERMEQQKIERDAFNQKVSSILREEETQQFIMLAQKLAEGLETIVPKEEEHPGVSHHRGGRH